MTTRIIDTETTGVDPESDRVIQIGSIDLLGNGGFYNPMVRLVDPGIPIPPTASAVHHIIDADVRGQPQFRDVVADFAGADLYVAHNAPFDAAFLGEALGCPRWICTLRVALRVWPEAPSHSNQALRYWRGLIEPLGVTRESVRPHDAISDVIVTGALFLELAKAASFKDMLQWSSEPALRTVCTFGNKHRGKRFDAIAADDPSYLEWIVSKSEMDADTKWSAQYWLDRRQSR